VLAPGAGSRAGGPLLAGIAAGLAAQGHPVVAFDFAYGEAGRARPDPAPRLEAAWRDALAAAVPILRELGAQAGPPVLGGRSMGGRIAMHLVAQGEPCAGLALLGYPLHPPRRPGAGGAPPADRLRTAHWPDLRVPVLFVQGDRDALCDLDLLGHERVRLGRGDSRVHVLAGADHGFRPRGGHGSPAREAGRDMLAEVVDAVAGWLDGLPEGP